MSTKLSTEQMPELVSQVSAEAGIDLPAEPTLNNFPELSIVLEQPTNANAFWSVLMNKIGMTIVDFKVWQNPLSALKGEDIPYGEIIERITMNPAIAKDYDSDPDTQFSVVIADAKVEFHSLNSKKFTTVSMNRAKIKQGFSSPSALAKTIQENINTLVAGKNIYEYRAMINTLSTAVNSDYVVTENLARPVKTQASADNFVETLKKYGLAFGFPSTAYNKYSAIKGNGEIAFETYTDISDLYLIIPTDILSQIDVYALSKAFNMEKETMLGHIIPVDRIGKKGEKEINAILCDKSFFQFHDYENTTAETFDARYLNYKFYHHFWSSFDISLLANCVAFIEG